MYSTILSQRASLLSAPTLNPINCSGGWSSPPAAVTAADRSRQIATKTAATMAVSFEARSTGHYYRFKDSMNTGSMGSTGSGGAVGSIDSRRSTSPQASRMTTRMDHVQEPIIPVVGAWIRDTPGTISLGQGVVHYGPPPEALDAVRAALAQPSTHEYNDGAGIPPLV